MGATQVDASDLNRGCAEATVRGPQPQDAVVIYAPAHQFAVQQQGTRMFIANSDARRGRDIGLGQARLDRKVVFCFQITFPRLDPCNEVKVRPYRFRLPYRISNQPSCV